MNGEINQIFGMALLRARALMMREALFASGFSSSPNSSVGSASKCCASLLIGFAFVFFIIPPLILWLIAAVMAIRHCKRQDMEVQMKKHAEMVGKQVAANLPRNDKT
jgi:hypothetical protein